jgi:hypothetical protein
MKTTLRLEKALSAGPYRVAANTKTAIEECSYYLPLMTALRTPGLRERHWLRIHEITGVDPDGDRRRWSMEIVIQLGFMDHLLEIGEVGPALSLLTTLISIDLSLVYIGCTMLKCMLSFDYRYTIPTNAIINAHCH